MTILCDNIKCVYCRHSPFYGYICFANNTSSSGLQISVDKSGKCTVYKKDTPENIKLSKANKPKIKE
jgi:hypothetical protein